MMTDFSFSDELFLKGGNGTQLDGTQLASILNWMQGMDTQTTSRSRFNFRLMHISKKVTWGNGIS